MYQEIREMFDGNILYPSTIWWRYMTEYIFQKLVELYIYKGEYNCL